MKKILMITIAAALTANMAMAQERGDAQQGRPNKEQMIKAKANKISKSLALDNKTAEEFIATYTKYQEEVAKINLKYPKKSMPAPDKEDGKQRGKKEMAADLPLPSDEEIEKEIRDGFAREKELINLKERYFNEFIKFLTPQQIQKMYMMESAPRQKGQSQMGNRPGPQGGRPGGFQGGPGMGGPGMGGMNQGMW